MWVVATKRRSCSFEATQLESRLTSVPLGDWSAGTIQGAALTELHRAVQSARSVGKAC